MLASLSAFGGRRPILATAALSGYVVLAVVLTWPLATHLTSQLPGDPRGDTGVYVWNLWIFRHEFLSHGHLPFTTEHIFAFTGGSDFSLHNYTPIAGLIGMPFISWLGVVGAFNTVLMAVLALSGTGLYLLGMHTGLRPSTAWIGGGLFMSAPLVSARETAHLSLVTNAALPLFLYALLRTLDRPSRRGAALVGLAVAMAAYSDAYYGIYCIVMGAFLVGWRFLRVERSRAPGNPPAAVLWMDALAAVFVGAVIVPLVIGRTDLLVGNVTLRELNHPFTPMLALVLLGLLRSWMTTRPTVRVVSADRRPGGLLEAGVLSVVVCLVCLSPLLVGIGQRYLQGRLPETVTYWRSSPRGVDLLAYLVPNPTHAWAGRWTERWLLPDIQDAFPELVASFSILAIAGIVVAGARRALPGMWVAFTSLFVLLSLGPFIHVAGTNTFVIGPWAVLRYVPIIGLARSPSRFAIVAVMGMSLLFAWALQNWLVLRRGRSTIGGGILVGLIALEVIPGPRTLYSAAVPEVYRLVSASDDEQGRLLELPAGVRDGTSSLGDFNAATAFFQTAHERPLIGGYLSRVSEWRKRESLRTPMLRALYQLSAAHGTIDEGLAEAARDSRIAFLMRSCLRYVVVDKDHASSELRGFARDALGLVPIHEDERYELLTPSLSPPCESSSDRHTHSRDRQEQLH